MFRAHMTRPFAFLVICLLPLAACGGGDSPTTDTGTVVVEDTAENLAEKFRTGWNESSETKMVNCLESGSGFAMYEALDSYCRRVGWDVTSLPKLNKASMSGGASEKTAVYKVGGDTVEVVMEKRTEGWVITKLEPKVKLNLKDIKDVVAEFEKTWNANDVDGVCNFLIPEMSDRKKSFHRLFKKRGWDAKLPQISTPSIEQGKPEEYRTTFFIGDAGELQLKWIVQGGRWGLKSLRPPKTD